MPDDYIPRVVDASVQRALSMRGALLIKGPKWSGKTRTAERFCGSALYIDQVHIRDAVRNAMSVGSDAPLNGESPRLIDEWQSVPEVLDRVRHIVDHHPDRRFILTGSSTPPEDMTLHAGTGRMGQIVLRTMSLFESGESNGQVSLAGLFAGDRVDACSDAGFDRLVHAIVRGGWPAAVIDDGPESREYARRYLRTLIEEDMPRTYLRLDDGDRAGSGLSRERVKDVTRRAIQSISRNLGTPASVSRILSEINGEDGRLSPLTFGNYLEMLKGMYVLENLEAWNPHIRSGIRLRTKPKWHLTDPSIAAAALGIDESELMMDPNALGFFFESMCLRDLRVYAGPLGGRVGFFTTSNDFEIDLVVELDDGRWGAFEVKTGSMGHDRAARNLLKLADKVDTSITGEPSFLAVLTGTGIGYTREDGVHIVPIGCLGP